MHANTPDTLLQAIVDTDTQDKILINSNPKLSKLDEINKGVQKGSPNSPTVFNLLKSTGYVMHQQFNIQQL